MNLKLLRDRSHMLRQARSFFFERDVLEVDCPALSSSACVDQHIDVMKVDLGSGQTGYLHTSPEYGMKRLLAAGLGDIYQISHVFRAGEIGPLHNPEFTMAEWYRCGLTFPAMIEETLDFIRLFLGNLPSQQLTYRAAFKSYLNIDYTAAIVPELLQIAQERQLSLPDNASSWDKDTVLQLVMSFLIEPHLGSDSLLVLLNFPATQSALSRTTELPCGERIASRFEVYYRGIELANGYHELTDPEEQKKRFEASNAARQKAGKELLQIDERLIEALQQGLPDCCGVAVGFDRLMLLRHQQKDLTTVLPFIWASA